MDNEDKFLKEYLNYWTVPSEGYKEAYKLWVKYHYECERYDQFVCTGELDDYGFIRPASGFERQMINQNATNLMNQMLLERKRIGISKDDFQNAKNIVGRLTCKGLQEEYERLYINQY